MIFGIKTKKDKKIEMLEALLKSEFRKPLVVHNFIKPTVLAATANEMFFDDAWEGNEDVLIRLLKNEVCRKMSNELLDQYIDYNVEHIMGSNGPMIKVTGYLKVIK